MTRRVLLCRVAVAAGGLAVSQVSGARPRVASTLTPLGHIDTCYRLCCVQYARLAAYGVFRKRTWSIGDADVEHTYMRCAVTDVFAVFPLLHHMWKMATAASDGIRRSEWARFFERYRRPPAPDVVEYFDHHVVSCYPETPTGARLFLPRDGGFVLRVGGARPAIVFDRHMLDILGKFRRELA